jgi:hypothetical protein
MPLQPQLLRRDLVRRDLAAADFADARRGGDGDLVETVPAVHHQRVRCTERGEHARHDFDEAFRVDAEDLPLRERGVRERPEDVEDRADAELFAHARDGGHRGMELRCKQE